jgi:hypothetical protein
VVRSVRLPSLVQLRDRPTVRASTDTEYPLSAIVCHHPPSHPSSPLPLTRRTLSFLQGFEARPLPSTTLFFIFPIILFTLILYLSKPASIRSHSLFLFASLSRLQSSRVTQGSLFLLASTLLRLSVGLLVKTPASACAPAIQPGPDLHSDQLGFLINFPL